MQGDVYTGTDTVEYLATGVPECSLQQMSQFQQPASRDTLRKQASWLRKIQTSQLFSRVTPMKED